MCEEQPLPDHYLPPVYSDGHHGIGHLEHHASDRFAPFLCLTVRGMVLNRENMLQYTDNVPGERSRTAI